MQDRKERKQLLRNCNLTPRHSFGLNDLASTEKLFFVFRYGKLELLQLNFAKSHENVNKINMAENLQRFQYGRQPRFKSVWVFNNHFVYTIETLHLKYIHKTLNTILK